MVVVRARADRPGGMTGPLLDAGEAEVLVEARLGRPPQDMLEAAVVLEAWAGVPAQRALATARAMMPATPRAPQRSVGRLPERGREDGVLVEGLVLVVTVAAIAAWAAPLTASLGREVVAHALALALPVAFALQWGLQRRYLDHPDGARRLAARRAALLGGGALVVAAGAALGVTGLLAGLLAVTWTGGMVLVRRGWALVYVAAVALATPAMVAGVAAFAAVAAVAAVVAAAVAAALAPDPAAAPPVPGPWAGALVAGAIGAGLGLMLVLDDTVSWTAGAVPALALVPSTVAAFWGGHHLRRLNRAIPAALSGVPAAAARSRGRAVLPLAVLAGVAVRVLGLSAALSAVLLGCTPWLGTSARGGGVLLGFALMALASLLVGLLQALGRGGWALVAVGCAATGEATLRIAGGEPFAGVGLVAGAAVALAIVVPVVVALLSRPASTLATALWIR
jgi:hypothetical protein